MDSNRNPRLAKPAATGKEKGKKAATTASGDGEAASVAKQLASLQVSGEQEGSATATATAPVMHDNKEKQQ